MVMLLKDLSTARFRMEGMTAGEMGASVAMTPRSVAMLGWIMPAPFVMPAILYSTDGDEGRVKDLEMSFGNVSVVQIAVAHDIQCLCESPRLPWAAGTLLNIF